jgi:hypothetical protein
MIFKLFDEAALADEVVCDVESDTKMIRVGIFR